MERDMAFKEMEGSFIIDKNEIIIGQIIDFSFNKEYEVTYFIMEPKLEFIKDVMNEFEQKIAYLIPTSAVIAKQGNNVQIDKPIDQLTKIMDFKIPGNLCFTKIRNSTVLDSNYDSIGQIIDAVFHTDDKISFVVGGGGFKEFLKKIGITPNHHLFLPHRNIKEYKANKFILNATKDELGTILNDVIISDSEDRRIYDASTVSSDKSDLVLHRDMIFRR